MAQPPQPDFRHATRFAMRVRRKHQSPPKFRPYAPLQQASPRCCRKRASSLRSAKKGEGVSGIVVLELRSTAQQPADDPVTCGGVSKPGSGASTETPVSWPKVLGGLVLAIMLAPSRGGDDRDPWTPVSRRGR